LSKTITNTHFIFTLTPEPSMVSH